MRLYLISYKIEKGSILYFSSSSNVGSKVFPGTNMLGNFFAKNDIQRPKFLSKTRFVIIQNFRCYNILFNKWKTYTNIFNLSGYLQLLSMSNVITEIFYFPLHDIYILSAKVWSYCQAQSQLQCSWTELAFITCTTTQPSRIVYLANLNVSLSCSRLTQCDWP